MLFLNNISEIAKKLQISGIQTSGSTKTKSLDSAKIIKFKVDFYLHFN